jgi:hypothetical protein
MFINILVNLLAFKQPKRYNGRHRAGGLLRVLPTRREA